MANNSEEEYLNSDDRTPGEGEEAPPYFEDEEGEEEETDSESLSLADYPRRDQELEGISASQIFSFVEYAQGMERIQADGEEGGRRSMRREEESNASERSGPRQWAVSPGTGLRNIQSGEKQPRLYEYEQETSASTHPRSLPIKNWTQDSAQTIPKQFHDIKAVEGADYQFSMEDFLGMGRVMRQPSTPDSPPIPFNSPQKDKYPSCPPGWGSPPVFDNHNQLSGDLSFPSSTGPLDLSTTLRSCDQMTSNKDSPVLLSNNGQLQEIRLSASMENLSPPSSQPNESQQPGQNLQLHVDVKIQATVSPTSSTVSVSLPQQGMAQGGGQSLVVRISNSPLPVPHPPMLSEHARTYRVGSQTDVGESNTRNPDGQPLAEKLSEHRPTSSESSGSNESTQIPVSQLGANLTDTNVPDSGITSAHDFDDVQGQVDEDIDPAPDTIFNLPKKMPDKPLEEKPVMGKNETSTFRSFQPPMNSSLQSITQTERVIKTLGGEAQNRKPDPTMTAGGMKEPRSHEPAVRKEGPGCGQGKETGNHGRLSPGAKLSGIPISSNTKNQAGNSNTKLAHSKDPKTKAKSADIDATVKVDQPNPLHHEYQLAITSTSHGDTQQVETKVSGRNSCQDGRISPAICPPPSAAGGEVLGKTPPKQTVERKGADGGQNGSGARPKTKKTGPRSPQDQQPLDRSQKAGHQATDTGRPGVKGNVKSPDTKAVVKPPKTKKGTVPPGTKLEDNPSALWPELPALPPEPPAQPAALPPESPALTPGVPGLDDNDNVVEMPLTSLDTFYLHLDRDSQGSLNWKYIAEKRGFNRHQINDIESKANKSENSASRTLFKQPKFDKYKISELKVHLKEMDALGETIAEELGFQI